MLLAVSGGAVARPDDVVVAFAVVLPLNDPPLPVVGLGWIVKVTCKLLMGLP